MDLPGMNSGPLRPGSRLGPYVIDRVLGRGAMGQVFQARRDDGQGAALKVLLGSGGARRFARETKALRALRHEGIVRYLDAAEGPPAWLAMQLVEGETLRDLLRRGPATPSEAADLVAQAAEAMAHAHAQGIVHRDLKPENLLLRRADGKLLVADFGLTRSLDGSRMTQSGALLGTFVYMSPEQVAGQRAGPPADVWSLGVILYECLSGELPFDEGDSLALAVAIADRPFPPLDAALPGDLRATCEACLSKDPAERPSAEALARALRARSGVRRPAERWKGAVLAIALVLGLSAGLGALSLGTSEPPGPKAPAGPSLETAGPDPSGVPEPPAPASPWPSAGPEEQHAWSLGTDTAPRIPAPGLWERPGHIAAPLAGAKRGVADAFFGAPTVLDDGRVAVRYDLLRAKRILIRDPAAWIALGDPFANRVEGGEGAVRLRAPNDGTTLEVWVGNARWGRPRVRFRLRRVERIDIETLSVGLGAAPSRAVLTFYGRAKRTQVSRGRGHAARVGRGLPDEWTAFALEPGAAGPRVRLGDLEPPPLNEVLSLRPTPGPIQITLQEIHVAVREFEVTGDVVRPDVPAWAVAPVELPTSCRVSAAFRADGEGQGGPALALVDEHDAPAFSLELDGARLALSRQGNRVALAEAPAGVRAGWLQLERSSDTIRGVLVSADGARVELQITDPLPVAAGLRAAYGSTAARIEFSAVEVHRGANDAERGAFDETYTLNGLDAALAFAPSSPAGRWRQAALRLASVSVPAFAPPELTGAAAKTARRRVALEAARELAEVSREGPQREDAMARGVLAQIVAAEANATELAAAGFVRAVGLERARLAFDRLETREGTPLLLERVRGEFGSVIDLAPRTAALRAALVLAPEHKAETLAGMGRLLRERHDPGSGPENLEEALRLFERARAADPTVRFLELWTGETLMDLRRFDEALPHLRAAAEANPRHYWTWSRYSLCAEALGRPREALERALGALAFDPGSRVPQSMVYRLARQLAGEGRMLDGLTSAALHSLAEARKEPRLAPPASAIQAANGDSRDADLAAYVRARLGTPTRPAGTRPTAILARARSGDADARHALRGASERDPFVLHLALLDPDLAPLVR